MQSYLYLARRDKKEIKIISSFSGSAGQSRINDVKLLLLPQPVEAAITKMAFENRFLWELWLESAENYDNLRKKLLKSGYKFVPQICDPLMPIKAQPANLNLFKEKPKMLQRKGTNNTLRNFREQKKYQN